SAHPAVRAIRTEVRLAAVPAPDSGGQCCVGRTKILEDANHASSVGDFLRRNCGYRRLIRRPRFVRRETVEGRRPVARQISRVEINYEYLRLDDDDLLGR